ncbi:hypothetical protein [Nocardia huaxiensis]|uniref:hypothetical protein n=1 Tax=Nocardia huaxiensis TaxID=2755382 RepID=UPI001E28EB33|nr:hypothetical protein [Nocardia huaxiensis]UFS96964.1 hypothetical protein LPY97_03240 [Nocardia huaxiensis]
MPVITDLETATRTPELAVLSAVAHRRAANHRRILEIAVAALDILASQPGSRSSEQARIYFDFIWSTLSNATRATLEEWMSTTHREYLSDTFRDLVAQGREEGREEGRKEGRTAGAIRTLLLVLEARGFDVPHTIRDRIENCTDVDQLEVWTQRAVVTTAVTDLFD